MRRLGYTAIGTTAVVLALAGYLMLLPAQEVRTLREDAPAPAAATQETPSRQAQAQAAEPTLYCEFTNFADQNPRVGFYFAVPKDRRPPVYAQIFQRERDGAQIDYGGESGPRPEWAFDGSENPAVIRSPDDAIRINLYDYDPARAGTNWFEAGLRSNRYLNLGGKCRHSTS